jgi:hypothetical protein
MNNLTDVEPGTEREVLKNVRDLLKDHILPRLTDLEVEVQYLRKVCWPVCQALSEKTQIDDIENKKKFLDEATNSLEEVKMLLREKQKIHKRLVQLGISTTCTDLVEYEFKKLFSFSSS